MVVEVELVRRPWPPTKVDVRSHLLSSHVSAVLGMAWGLSGIKGTDLVAMFLFVVIPVEWIGVVLVLSDLDSASNQGIWTYQLDRQLLKLVPLAQGFPKRTQVQAMVGWTGLLTELLGQTFSFEPSLVRTVDRITMLPAVAETAK